jgi:hypothetical protein
MTEQFDLSKKELDFLKDIRNKYFSDLDSITGDKDIYDYLDEVRMELDNRIKELEKVGKELIEGEDLNNVR